MLKEMYDKYALPTLTCPVTGRKFSINKHVIELVPGRSGYAASGTVVAKKYNPTLT
jgi:nitric oxide synthase-interacting protein